MQCRKKWAHISSLRLHRKPISCKVHLPSLSVRLKAAIRTHIWRRKSQWSRPCHRQQTHPLRKAQFRSYRTTKGAHIIRPCWKLRHPSANETSRVHLVSVGKQLLKTHLLWWNQALRWKCQSQPWPRPLLKRQSYTSTSRCPHWDKVTVSIIT